MSRKKAFPPKSAFFVLFCATPAKYKRERERRSETEVGREGGRERKGDCERAREILNNTLIDRQ